MSKISFQKDSNKDTNSVDNNFMQTNQPTKVELDSLDYQVPDNASQIDVNLIIVSFQDKISQLMTEIVVKDATIRQQANLINKLKGNK